MNPGIFFVWEGIDKSGKSGQLERAAGYLIGMEYTVITTKEPGGGLLNLRAKIMELDRSDPDISENELALFEADRRIHCKNLIIPALVLGKIVLCDRFENSTIAFQGYGRGMDLEKIRAANYAVTLHCHPDLTILMDLDPQIAAKRVTKEDQINRFESEPMDFHRRVREGHLAEAKLEPKRWLIIDATLDKNTITKQIIGAINKKLSI